MFNNPSSSAAIRMKSVLVIACGSLLALGAGRRDTGNDLAGDPDPVDFNRDVRPLLADRCFHCHGPDEHDRKAGLRLDRADGPDGAYRVRRGIAAIKPGSPKDSAVWRRLTAEDPIDVMPPTDSHKRQLTADERDIIRRWIQQGAGYQRHWAFAPVEAPTLPDVDDPRWNAHPIDRVVLRRLNASGLRPRPRADKRTIIRRLSLDLIGLPPSRDEIRAFLEDEAPGAYSRLVDRLLVSPHYGEHMAKYWLDLVRFADTNGVHHDHFRDMSPYRDWVIRSWNDNLPYDRFITDQIAGDLHAAPTDDQLIASGFNRLHMIIDRGTALPEESFARNVIDRVTAVGTAFMGLTVQCAVCHDHKYDPIKQSDFYGLFAFFNNIDADPETGGRSGADFRRGVQPPYISFPTPEQEKGLARLDRDLGRLRPELERLDGLLKTEKDAAKRKSLQAEQRKLRKRVQQTQRKRDLIEQSVTAAMIMKERKDVRPAHVLLRGDYARPGPVAPRATPSFLPPLETATDVPSRMDLARWMVRRDHPLTARVAVNRFWQQLFGVGIVKTSEDFGIQGEWPTDPDLLDHLAVSFVDSGWDVKALLRHIVTSETYRQSSVASPESFAKDPENRLLGRGARFRLDSEVIRDQILATSGLLNRTMYGRSVKPPQPAGIWKAVTLPSSFPRTYEPDTGDEIYRRSVYTFWKRGMPPPQMTILDAPTRESCVARRERTNTPLQALLLMNEPEYLKAARHLAVTTLEDESDETQRLNAIYETITSRLPDDREARTLLSLVREMTATYRANGALADRLCEGLEVATAKSKVEIAAWSMLVSTVYNLDITKTRE